MTNRSTYESSLKTDSQNLQFGGWTGNGAAPAALSSTNVTIQYPSVATLRILFGNGTINQATFAQLMTATAGYTQCQDRAARDLLVGNSDIGY